MADNSTYHRLPEDNRPSLESNARDDERLLGTYNDHEDDPPKKGFIISFRPTFYTRSIVFILLSVSIGFVIYVFTVPCVVFIVIAMIRNFMVLFHHILSKRIRVRIELVNDVRPSARARPWPDALPEWLTRNRLQIFIDLTIGLALFITVTTAIRKLHTGYILVYVALYAVLYPSPDRANWFA
jgi:hypothetical protein